MASDSGLGKPKWHSLCSLGHHGLGGGGWQPSNIAHVILSPWGPLALKMGLTEAVSAARVKTDPWTAGTIFTILFLLAESGSGWARKYVPSKQRYTSVAQECHQAKQLPSSEVQQGLTTKDHPSCSHRGGHGTPEQPVSLPVSCLQFCHNFTCPRGLKERVSIYPATGKPPSLLVEGRSFWGTGITGITVNKPSFML